MRWLWLDAFGWDGCVSHRGSEAFQLVSGGLA
jgi:hypothetical protein